MADSVTATDIPPGVFELVAGYVDGLYAWTEADWLFHHASRLVTITVLGGTAEANVADVENGDLTAVQGASWAGNRILAGHVPIIYASRSRFGEIAAAMGARGINNAQWNFWAADWTGVPHILPGTYATQYADPAYGSGGHYDVSLVADFWPGVDPPGAPAPAPIPVPPPQPGNPPPDSPPPFIPGVPPGPPPAPSDIDTTRTAWSNLASWLTQDLPAFVQEILRLLGLYRRTP